MLEARPSEGEWSAAGDVMNTAARIESAAPVEGILVGELTYRSTRDLFEYRHAGAAAHRSSSCTATSRSPRDSRYALAYATCSTSGAGPVSSRAFST